MKLSEVVYQPNHRPDDPLHVTFTDDATGPGDPALHYLPALCGATPVTWPWSAWPERVIDRGALCSACHRLIFAMAPSTAGP